MMHRLISLFESNLQSALGWTLLHSLWQICLVAIVIRFLLMFIRPTRPNARYILLLAGLLIALFWSAFTFYQVWNSIGGDSLKYQVQVSSEPLSYLLSPTASNVYRSDHSQAFQITTLSTYLPHITLFWWFGATLLSLYVLFGLGYLRYLQIFHLSDPGKLWRDRIGILTNKLGIKTKVTLHLSNKISGPITYQLFKPVIVLPVSLLSSMPQEQVELLILHELAHIRRHDFWINLLQCLAEILFFFHPALWWMSKQMRIEREYCCDQLVMETQNTPHIYADSLTHLSNYKFKARNTLAMAANKNSSNLSNRIFRLFGHYRRESLLSGGLVSFTLLVALCMLTLSFSLMVPDLAMEMSAQKTLDQNEKDTIAIKKNTGLVVNSVSEELLDENTSTQSSRSDHKESGQARRSAKQQPMLVHSSLDSVPTDDKFTITADTVGLRTLTDDIPFYVVNGQVQNSDFQMSQIPAEDIRNATIWQRELAPDEFNPNVKYYYAVEIVTESPSTSHNTPNEDSLSIISEIPIAIPEKKIDSLPIFVLDGIVKGTDKDYKMSELDPSSIKEINVLKGEKAIEKYGPSGEFGVVEITTKSSSELSHSRKKKVGTKINVEDATPKNKDGNIDDGRLYRFKGQVLDEEKKPLIGTNVLIIGTNTGTITDLNGQFTLETTKRCVNLAFTYVGMETKIFKNKCATNKLKVRMKKE